MNSAPELDAGRVALLWALAVAGLIAAFQVPAGQPPPALSLPLFAAAALLAATASFFRRRETSSGAAALWLPLLLVSGGPALGAALFAAAVGAACWLRGTVRCAIDPRRAFLAAARAALTALTAVFLQPAAFSGATAATGGLAVGAFLGAGWLLDGFTPAGATLSRRWISPLPALAVEGAALAFGLLALRFDRTATLLLLGLASLLFFETARQALRFERGDRQRLTALAAVEEARKTDPGLAVLSRDELLNQLERRFRAGSENANQLAVVVVDPDALERHNSESGLTAGDRLLRSLVDLTREEFGPDCLVGRYQGATLAVLLPGADGAAALASAEALRRRYAGRQPAAAGRAETVSCGIAAYPELPVRQGEDLVLLAEKAMRLAKQLGRNRCLADLGARRFLDGSGRRVQAAEEQEQGLPRTPTFFA